MIVRLFLTVKVFKMLNNSNFRASVLWPNQSVSFWSYSDWAKFTFPERNSLLHCVNENFLFVLKFCTMYRYKLIKVWQAIAVGWKWTFFYKFWSIWTCAWSKLFKFWSLCTLYIVQINCIQNGSPPSHSNGSQKFYSYFVLPNLT